MTTRRDPPVLVCLAISMAAPVRGAAVPDARELREALRRDVRRMPTLLRQYAFADLPAEGLTFVPVPGKGKVEMVAGRWPEQQAVRLDRGRLQGEPVDVPGRGFTVTCWFRCHGIATVGTGYHDGWRIVLLPSSGRMQFDIGRPEGGSASAVCRTGVEQDRWHHLAATWDRRSIAVYLDGRRRVEAAYDGGYAPARVGSALRIGECGSGVGTVKVDMAELVMFGEALAPDVITRMVDPSAEQADTIVACLMQGDRAAKNGPGSLVERERAAREEYAKILALDASENPPVVGNYRAIARLRLIDSLRREHRLDQARRECGLLADDESAALHYRERAMLLAGDTYRDERRYQEAA